MIKKMFRWQIGATVCFGLTAVLLALRAIRSWCPTSNRHLQRPYNQRQPHLRQICRTREGIRSIATTREHLRGQSRVMTAL